MSTPGPTLGRDQIEQLLIEVGALLERDGNHGDIYIVDGTAIALTMNSRRVTEDVDVAFRASGKDIIKAAAEVGARHGLRGGWLNASVTAFVPTMADDGAEVIEVPGRTIAVASPEHVLAMTMMSARPGRDQDDLEFLFERLGITTPEQAVEILRRVYGDNDILLADPIESSLFEARDVLRRIELRRGEAAPVAGPRPGDRDRDVER